MFARVYDDLGNFFRKRKALIIYGARRTGKTTLLENYLKKTDLRYRLDSGDNVRVQELLSSRDFKRIADYVSGYELLAIDEAQEVPDIGKALKIIIDQSPDTIVIATGSSSFDLSQKVGEPLTGRKVTILLYPMSHKELIGNFTGHELREKLEDYLIFGSYPEVLSTESKVEKIAILKELVDSYLLKDILSHERIKSPKALLQLLKLLAFQIGSQVSLNELATRIGMDVKTVDRYLNLLEKSFVIKRFGGFSGNLRKEIVSKGKVFFLDTGIRNAVISQFSEIENRNDMGQLFENFLMMERAKKRDYEGFYGNAYFWRTYDGQEIDLVEEIDNRLAAFEVKWSTRGRRKVPKDWHKSYPAAEYTLIDRNNYLDFII